MMLIAFAVALFMVVDGHPDKRATAFPWQCSAKTATFYSFHIHVMFHQQVPANVAATLELRTKFAQHFNVTRQCDDKRTDNTTNPPKDMCLLDWDVPPTPPFTTSEWAIFLPKEHFPLAAWWIMQNRGDFDIFIHPNTGCEVEDHRDWGMWGGHRLRFCFRCSLFVAFFCLVVCLL
jgi:aromatic ring-cleaving dioxygenase